MVWSRHCTTSSDPDNPALSDGWLAGFEFIEDEGNTRITDVPHELLRSGRVAVSVLLENDATECWPNTRDTKEKTSSVLSFSQQSLLSVKAAADELLPVLGKHFTDVRLVITRDRLEISAPFRPLADLNFPVARRPDFGTARAIQLVSPPALEKIEPSAASLQADGARAKPGRRRGLVALASLAAVIVSWSFFGPSHKSHALAAASAISVEGRSVPAWAPGLDESSVDGWIGMQKQFDLPDATVRSAIQILRSNDKYSPGQSLYDLSRYPGEVKRAFGLLASTASRTPVDFGALKNDLQARMMNGVRFPDEAPGGQYSPLERESFNNLLVLATIELLHRRQNDPAVKAILAALGSGGS